MLPGVGNAMGTLWVVGAREVSHIESAENRHNRFSQSLRRPARLIESLDDYATFVAEFLPVGEPFPDVFRAGAKLSAVFRTGTAARFSIRSADAQVLGATEHFIDLLPTTRARAEPSKDLATLLKLRLEFLAQYAAVARPSAVIVHCDEPMLEPAVQALRAHLSRLRIFHARLPYRLGAKTWTHDALRLAVHTLREYRQMWEVLIARHHDEPVQ